LAAVRLRRIGASTWRTGHRLVAQASARWPIGRDGRRRSQSLAVSVKRSAVVTASTRPIAWACFAEAERPVSMNASASGAPIRRGRRAEPPQPGKMPSLTSGRPIRVDGSSLAMR